MAKQAYVYSGTDWVPLASEVTNLSTYQTKASTGLVLLNTTSFSGVASQSINDVFSATYDNYKIVISGTNSTANASVSLRFRVSGTDNSTANSYVSQSARFLDTASTFSRSAATSGTFTVMNNTLVNACEMMVVNPFLATPTAWISQTYSSLDTAATYIYSGSHNQTVSYTGFTFIPTSNTITGVVSVYGFNK